MIPETLSIVERQILSNQFRILEKLEEDKDYYRTKAEILENGYTGRYGEVFLVNRDEIPFEVCKETSDILNMYRRINYAISSLSDEDKEEMELEKIKFEGFDGNNDSHYHYMEYMVENLNLWQEHKDNYLNSHSVFPIEKYRTLLEYQNRALEDKMDLSKEDIERMIELV